MIESALQNPAGAPDIATLCNVIAEKLRGVPGVSTVDWEPVHRAVAAEHGGGFWDGVHWTIRATHLALGEDFVSQMDVTDEFITLAHASVANIIWEIVGGETGIDFTRQPLPEPVAPRSPDSPVRVNWVEVADA